MISFLEALRYRCLRDLSLEITPFQVLVGPNASGKSSLLDVPVFVRDLLREGLLEAIRLRTPSLKDLVWMGASDRFEVALELRIPLERCRQPDNGHRQARYEIAIGRDRGGEPSILGETLWLKSEPAKAPVRQMQLFPGPPEPRESFFLTEGRRAPPGWRKVITKTGEAGNDYFFSETTGWHNPFRLGPQRLALANLPEDEEHFPVAIWVRWVLTEGIQRLELDTGVLRQSTPPGSPTAIQPDGSNLAGVIESLRTSDPEGFGQWVAHVKTALPHINGIEIAERPKDRHRYLRVKLASGSTVPSWSLSEGTLRLLALTLVSFVDSPGRIFLIEEPENGMDPQATRCVFQALSSARDCQVLCTSHSPLVLSLAEPAQLLCFAKTAEGVTDVVSGTEHPGLADWQRQADRNSLLAPPILG